MKSNGLLKWLLVPVLLLAVWIGVKVWAPRPAPAPPRGATAAPLTPAEMADLGIPADTPRDTVATLVAQVQRLRGDLQSSLSDDRTQRAEQAALRTRLSEIESEIQATAHSESEHWQNQSTQAASDASEKLKTQDEIEGLKDKLNALGGKAADVDLPSGLGLPDTDAAAPAAPAIRWVEPLGAPTAKAASPASTPESDPFHVATSFRAEDTENSSATPSPEDESQKTAAAAKPAALAASPVYTVPANSTLMGSVAMTALIGRIPVNGTVEDPYPFKVLVGPDNLTANGIDLPNVAGAVMSGTASGDWTLSCVRGRISSVTFVFRDGTVRTVPAADAAGTSAASSGQDGVGWISDPYGIPCVSGQRRSNAKQYLTSQMLITAAGAGAASLIRDENGEFSYVAGNGSSLGTVGISGNDAMGRILSGGVDQMSQWVNKLYGQAFAAVYVAPGAQVAVHIVRPINVDYDPSGRRVRYDAGVSNAADLD